MYILKGLYYPLDGVTNPKYKLLCFLTFKILFSKEKKAVAFNWYRCCHAHPLLCLWLILFHLMAFRNTAIICVKKTMLPC
jgi:hypothetical protein